MKKNNDNYTFIAMDKMQSKEVGYCIYCKKNIQKNLTEKLTKEHIIPKGLKGNLTLLKASCDKHRDITSRFERDVLRKQMREARTILGLPSRRKKWRPKIATIGITKNGSNKMLNLPINDYPGIISFPVFSKPGYFNKLKYKSGIKYRRVVTVSLKGDLKEYSGKLNVDTFRVKEIINPVSFAKLLAKIAYGMAIYDNNIKLIKSNSQFLDALLGEKDEIGMWVGNLNKNLIRYNKLSLFNISNFKDITFFS